MKLLFLWLVVGAALIAAPLLLGSGATLGQVILIEIMVIFALSYNVLFGQTGLLSFGHAVFYGLSGFAVVHAITAVGSAGLRIPLPLLPLFGGLVGLCFGWLLGSVATRRAGTAFAMITLGIGELVLSFTPILKTFFGGESGITTDRTEMPPMLGLSFGPQTQVAFLVAAWCLLCMLLLYGVTRTPFGTLCNAVRENPERADFAGYDVYRIRKTAFMVSSFFAGIAGGLAAINFEIMSVESMGGLQSAWVLFMTYIGGAGSFAGPILGTVIVSLMQFSLPDVTPGWQLYLGLFFIVIVMYAPGGISGLLLMHRPLWQAGVLRRVLPSYALAAIPTLVMLTGFILLVELGFRWNRGVDQGSHLNFFGFGLDAGSAAPWVAAVAALAVGWILLSRVKSKVVSAWAAAMQASAGRGAIDEH